MISTSCLLVSVDLNSNCGLFQISGSKASSWLGLGSDSDEGDDQMGDGFDEESAQLVTVKPHFEGKAGEEVSLLILQ